MEIAFGFPLLFSDRDFGFKFSDMAKCQFFKKRQRNAIKDHYATFLLDWKNRWKYYSWNCNHKNSWKSEVGFSMSKSLGEVNVVRVKTSHLASTLNIYHMHNLHPQGCQFDIYTFGTFSLSEAMVMMWCNNQSWDTRCSKFYYHASITFGLCFRFDQLLSDN